MANTHNILTGVKRIEFIPYNSTDAPVEADKEILESVVADTTTISQDDPETQTIDCETSDSPILETTKLGKYTIEMTSADIKASILTKCLGFTEGTSTLGGENSFFAPTAYKPIYAMLRIVMDKVMFVLPKVKLASKLDASSLKTDVAKGTISGTAFEIGVKVGNATTAVKCPFLIVEADNSGAFPTIEVEG